MIYKLFGSDTVMVCKRCEFQSKLGALPHPHGELNFCPECVKSWKGSVMVSLEEYLKQVLDEYLEQRVKEKMSRHIYCPACGFTGLADAFPQKNFQDAVGSENFCPVCFYGEDLINASEVKFCKECRVLPVYDDYDLCVGCSEMYEMSYENESDRERF